MKTYKDIDQTSAQWFELRCGIPTASEFKNLISEKALLKADIVKRVASYGEEKALSKKTVPQLEEIAKENGVDLSPIWEVSNNSYHYQLTAEVLAGYNPDPWMGNDHTEHGKDAEEAAVSQYEEEHSVKTEVVGFVTDDDHTMGCSPDRLVGEDGLLEIKAPMARNMVRLFCEEMSDDVCPKDHYIQIQGQLLITGRKWCDLCVYHPSLGIKTIRVLPNNEVQTVLLKAIKEVSKKRDESVLKMSGI